MVVLTSDHGEELFDHGGFEHGHAMWQELLHVPLVVWAPGVEPGRETAPVSLVDVAPTVLDSLGIAPPTPFDGISLWANLTAVEPLPQRPLFAEGVRRPQFSWTRIRGESDVEGGGGHGSVKAREGSEVAASVISARLILCVFSSSGCYTRAMVFSRDASAST